MRIVIDATSLLLRSAGIKSYTYYWLQALQETHRGHVFTGFPFLSAREPLAHDRSILPPVPTWTRLAALHATNSLPGLLDIFLHGAQIFHTSNQIHRRPKRARCTATIHDMTVWKMPELHTKGNIRADKHFAEEILKRVDRLITVSENSRKDAIQILDLKPESVRCIYPGVPRAYFTAGPSEIEQMRAQLQINRPYVLYVGTIEPRKNLERLLDSWATLPRDIHDEYELILAGPAGWSSDATQSRLSNGGVHSCHSNIRYLGYVPESLLPGLTAGATVLAYPSLYEGFGFPAAQALATGVPVLTSNISSLPEIAGDGALYVDPLSVGDIAAGLFQLLTEPERRKRLSLAARVQAARYTWERCANQSLDFFESVAGS